MRNVLLIWLFVTNEGNRWQSVTDIVFFLNAFFIVKFRSFRFENQQSPAIELENQLFFSFNE